MIDWKAKSREELLEIALRVALRKLGNHTLHVHYEDAAPRSAETFEIDLSAPWSGPVFLLRGGLSDDEALSILCTIDDGLDPIVSSEAWEAYTHPTFKSAAGHVVKVYNRGDSWRNVDSVTHADGRRWEYGDGCGRGFGVPNSVGDWEPENPKRWGIR